MNIKVLAYFDRGHFEWLKINLPLGGEYYDVCWDRNHRGEIYVHAEELTYEMIERLFYPLPHD